MAYFGTFRLICIQSSIASQHSTAQHHYRVLEVMVHKDNGTLGTSYQWVSNILAWVYVLSKALKATQVISF